MGNEGEGDMLAGAETDMAAAGKSREADMCSNTLIS